MRSFSDSEGAVWPLRVNGAAIQRIKDQCGVDFLDTETADGLWDQIISDPITFMGILRAVCEPTIVERELKETDFFERLTGKSLNEAKTHLAQEIVDFFREWLPDHGETLRATLAAQLLTHKKAERMVKTRLAEAEGRIEQAIDDVIDQAGKELDKELDKITNHLTSGKSSSSSPE